MCGIVAAYNLKKNKEVKDFILNLYQDQYSRGQEGFGIVSVNKTNKVTVTRATEPVKFLMDLKENNDPIIIAHHRKPTSTKNKLKQTHPIYVSNNKLKHDYYVVHNGMISNASKLRDDHIEEGFTYTTDVVERISSYSSYLSERFNDTEAFAIDIVKYIEGLSTELHFKGSAAFIVLQVDKKTKKAKKLFYGRHLNPLMVQKIGDIITLSSENDDGGVEIEEDVLFSRDLKENSTIEQEDLVYHIEPVITHTPTVHRNPMGFSVGSSSSYFSNYKKLEKNETEEEAEEEDKTEVDEAALRDYNESYEEIVTEIEDSVIQIVDRFVHDLCYDAENVQISQYMSEMHKALKEAKRRYEEEMLTQSLLIDD